MAYDPIEMEHDGDPKAKHIAANLRFEKWLAERRRGERVVTPEGKALWQRFRRSEAKKQLGRS
jgi:hypothetical protein